VSGSSSSGGSSGSDERGTRARSAAERWLYFAYGSNLDAEQMARRCPGSRRLEVARLGAHELAFTYYASTWKGGTADVLPHGLREVWGALYDLSHANLAALDRFEAGYDRVPLDIETRGGLRLCVQSYVVRERGRFAPSRIYLEQILRGARLWSLPPAYIAELQRVVVAAGAESGVLSPSGKPPHPR
jgi:gamma-glutamylcyclotransferase (GGCT)/AIG2-like uncharacterized protein YtfP